jgi:phenylpyruvate tautomerase PptA (4-oxalocrotonate tautomerase family)
MKVAVNRDALSPGPMPYLRITCPALDRAARSRIAERLTDSINDLFYNPRARLSRQELRERTTVHFTPYADAELFIGARTPAERGTPDVTVELSDWSMSVRQQRKVARDLTPVLAELFGVPPTGIDNINMRFHSYPPTDFSVGGRLLSDLVPRIGRLFKRLAG